MTGQLAEGEAVVDAALQQCQRTGEAWCRPELMRMPARLLLKRATMSKLLTARMPRRSPKPATAPSSSSAAMDAAAEQHSPTLNAGA
jgi:hypothetical protein